MTHKLLLFSVPCCGIPHHVKSSIEAAFTHTAKWFFLWSVLLPIIVKENLNWAACVIAALLLHTLWNIWDLPCLDNPLLCIPGNQGYLYLSVLNNTVDFPRPLPLFVIQSLTYNIAFLNYFLFTGVEGYSCLLCILGGDLSLSNLIYLVYLDVFWGFSYGVVNLWLLCMFAINHTLFSFILSFLTEGVSLKKVDL